VTGLLRAELRKTTSTRLWWGLFIPAGLLSVLINVFGGLFTAAIPVEEGRLPLLIGSLAYALGLTTVFAMVQGIVSAAAEFRHRTITTTYLTSARRSPVLLAKMATSALVGMVYALATVVLGVLAGLVGEAGSAFPTPGTLLAVTLIGMAVCALWGALGTALGTAVSNQVSALVGALVYVLLGELLISALLRNADSLDVRRLSAYLPGNAGDVAIYDIPARVLAGPDIGPVVVETLANVTAPPPWWGALLVLLAWTAAMAATAWVVADRRDVT
jgi:ABC-type transport system involved in multi-copper enzyme maturation permease subunit